MHPLAILERYWKHTSFRDLQEEIINSVIDNEDVLALLPTGGGKSICFQIPALAREGICIVVSPLIALMKDQVNTLNHKGIKAIAITSGINYKDLDAALDNCIYGNYKFLYLSPERLQQPIVQERIQQMNVNLIAVDEAHCISQWGHDFRPAYRSIILLRTLKPSCNVIALTATARPRVVVEIIKELDFLNPKVYKGSFYRSNIEYQVLKTEDKSYKLLQVLRNNPNCSIIYVRSRRNAEEISDYLNKHGLSSDFFHGGVDGSQKVKKLREFMTDKTVIMVATTAFGMGIDKSNVRSVIHFNLPESIESYFQESGRAGRDGQHSLAVIITNRNDEAHLRDQFLRSLPTTEIVKQIFRKLCNYFQVAFGEGTDQTFRLNFNDFCKTYNFNSSSVYNVFKILDRTGIIRMVQQFQYQTKLQFISNNQDLFKYLNQNKEIQNVAKSILRSYGGITDHLLSINIATISKKAGVSEKQVIKVLNNLKNDNMVEFEYNNTDTEITFLQPREDDKTINRISSTIENNITLKTNEVKSVIGYINNDNLCKHIQLLEYFGERNIESCGKCSTCKSKLRVESTSNSQSVRNSIIQGLETKPLSSRDLIRNLNIREEEVIEALRQLLEHNIVEITPANTYRIKLLK